MSSQLQRIWVCTQTNSSNRILNNSTSSQFSPGQSSPRAIWTPNTTKNGTRRIVLTVPLEESWPTSPSPTFTPRDSLVKIFVKKLDYYVCGNIVPIHKLPLLKSFPFHELFLAVDFKHSYFICLLIYFRNRSEHLVFH